MVWTLVKALLAFSLLVCAGQSTLAGKRVALVIGNSAYAKAPALTTPKNDANDMAAALKAVGFTVILGMDLDKTGMERKIREFAGDLSGAEAGVFHYSGHGLQVSGVNYLVPVDAELTTAAAVDFEAIRFDMVQRTMERETKNNILFLDACRNNPLTRNLARALGTRSTDIGNGLAEAKSGAGTLISFSTQPGNVALDGSGRNSPYSGPLAKTIGTSNKDILSVLMAVKKAVFTATNEQQLPWEHTALLEPFYFNPSAQTQPQASSSHSAEMGEVAELRTQIARLEEEVKAQRSKPHEEAALKQEIARLEDLRNRQEELQKRLVLQLNQGFAARPQSLQNSLECNRSNGNYIVINVKWNDPDGGLVISNGPGMNAGRLGVIPAAGGGIGILGCQGMWCRVRYRCDEGWSSKLYLGERQERQYRVIGVQPGAPEGLNVRSGPGFTYPQSGSISFDATNVVKHVCQSSPVDGTDWCLVSWQSISGWVAGRFLVQ